MPKSELCETCIQEGFLDCRIRKKVIGLTASDNLTRSEIFDQLLDFYWDNDTCTYLSKNISDTSDFTQFDLILNRLVTMKEPPVSTHTNGKTGKENNPYMTKENLMTVSKYLVDHKINQRLFAPIHTALKIWFEKGQNIVKTDIDPVTQALENTYSIHNIRPTSKSAEIINSTVHNLTGIILNGGYPEDL